MKTPHWNEMVGGRCLVKTTDLTAPDRNLVCEVIVQEVSPSGGHVRFFVVALGAAVWHASTTYELVELLPNNSPLAVLVEEMKLIHRLRNYNSTAMVSVLCNNEEGSGDDDVAIEVLNDDTDHDPRRFYGHTVLDALKAAAAWLDEKNKDNPLHRKILQ